MREGRDTVEYTDLLKAKHNRELGPAEGFEYIERERHAVAIHEACHAVSAYRVRMHFTIDLATIERRGDVGGFVSSIPPEDRFTHWRSEHEADIVVSLASLAGERMFFGQDNSSGVGGDLHGATSLAMAMQAFWGMGPTVASHAATLVARQGITARPEDGTDRNVHETSFGRQVEAQLLVLYERAERILEADRRYVFAVAHALETHQTITGEDVEAIFKGTKGPIVDGAQYATDEFMVSFEAYHLAAAEAHRRHAAVLTPLPVLRSAAPPIEVGNGIHVAAHDGRSPWAPPIVPGKGNGTGNGRP
jgi:ATP-dependent Zn protease